MGGAQEINKSWMEEDSSRLIEKDKSLDDPSMEFEEKIATKELIGKSSTDALFNLEDASSNSQDSNYDAQKERLVIKFRKISDKYNYYMVDDIPLPSDSPFKYCNYKSVRYSFPTCFGYTPVKRINPQRCKTCRKVFSKTSSLRIHRKTHAAFPPGPYTPKDFAKRFSNITVSREPYKPAAHLNLLKSVTPHPKEYLGYTDIQGPMPYIKPGLHLRLAEDNFCVGDMIGEGGFAKVFSATWENGPPEERNTVLKVQMPANDWEWYILNQVKFRFESLDHPLKARDGADTWRGGFMSSSRCYTYRDGAILISQLQKMGTLLDLVNLIKNSDKNIIEPIAIFLTAELLGLMELLHSVNIVHADLKPDNFLVRHIPSTQSSPSLQLIDFGKAIDLNLENEAKGEGLDLDHKKKLDYLTNDISAKDKDTELYAHTSECKDIVSDAPIIDKGKAFCIYQENSVINHNSTENKNVSSLLPEGDIFSVKTVSQETKEDLAAVSTAKIISSTLEIPTTDKEKKYFSLHRLQKLDSVSALNGTYEITKETDVKEVTNEAEMIKNKIEKDITGSVKGISWNELTTFSKAETKEDKDTASEEHLTNDGNTVSKSGRTGRYHLDYFGIAGAAYCLLFGKYIEVGTVKNRWVVKGSFKRWWQVKTWEKFFDEMLNPRGDDKDCLPSLLEWRNRFLDLFEMEELHEGLVKARQIIEVKLLEKWRRHL